MADVHMVQIDCYLTLVPRYWQGRVTDAKVGRVTQKRPHLPEGPVVKVRVAVPAAIFYPYVVEGDVVIDEGKLVPIEIEQQYEIDAAETGTEG